STVPADLSQLEPPRARAARVERRAVPTRAIFRCALAGVAAALCGVLACGSSSSGERAGGGAPATPATPMSPAPGASPPSPMELDADRVGKLYPDAAGAAFRLGDADLEGDARLSLEREGRASVHEEGPLRFWTIDAYAFEYSEGGEPGKTARVHV